MTRKQRLLAKVRAWIDQRLPRDVLRISVYDVSPNGPKAPLLSITHFEGILRCKYSEDAQSFKYGDVLIVLHTEHLSV